MLYVLAFVGGFAYCSMLSTKYVKKQKNEEIFKKGI